MGSAHLTARDPSQAEARTARAIRMLAIFPGRKSPIVAAPLVLSIASWDLRPPVFFIDTI
jgi:hypothetical protein